MGSMPTTPTSAEHDGWQVLSHGTQPSTEADIKESLGATAEEIAADAAAAARVAAADASGAASSGADDQTADDGGEGEAQAAGATEGDADSDADDQAGARDAADDPNGPKPKKTHWAKPRIDALTKQVNDERTRREALEREIEALKARPAATAAAATAPAAQATTPAAADTPAGAERPAGEHIHPMPTWGGPGGMEDQGKSYEDYLAEMNAWVVRESRAQVDAALERERERQKTDREREQQEREANARRDQIWTAHRARVQAAQTRYQDWQTVTAPVNDLQSVGLREIVLLHDTGPDVLYHLGKHPEQTEVLDALEFTPAILDALHAVEKPALVLAHYAQHPEEYDALKSLDPATTAVRVGTLFSRLDVAPAGGPTATARPKTNAKPPLRPPSGSAPTAGRGGGRDPDDLDALSDDEYFAVMNQRDHDAALNRTRPRL